MNKRILSIFLALTLILTMLAGCGGPADADSTGSPDPEHETEYTPEETDQSDIPSDEVETPSDEVDSPSDEHPSYVKLPIGCYAGFDNGYVFGYLEATDSTMIFYYDNGEIEIKARYSYDSDGSCVLVMDGAAVTVQFTYEQGIYYMNNGGESRRLEPISAIPTGNVLPDLDAYFIGSNGSMDLYVRLPEALYDGLDRRDFEGGGFSAQMEDYYDGSGLHLAFYSGLASGDYLREGIDHSRREYAGVFGTDADLLFRYFRDELMGAGLDSDFPGDVGEGYETINGREWRGCEAYARDEGIDLVLFFWMEGDNMAFVMVKGTVEDPGSFDDMAIITDIVYSLKLDTKKP